MPRLGTSDDKAPRRRSAFASVSNRTAGANSLLSVRDVPQGDPQSPNSPHHSGVNLGGGADSMRLVPGVSLLLDLSNGALAQPHVAPSGHHSTLTPPLALHHLVDAGLLPARTKRAASFDTVNSHAHARAINNLLLARSRKLAAAASPDAHARTRRPRTSPHAHVSESARDKRPGAQEEERDRDADMDTNSSDAGDEGDDEHEEASLVHQGDQRSASRKRRGRIEAAAHSIGAVTSGARTTSRTHIEPTTTTTTTQFVTLTTTQMLSKEQHAHADSAAVPQGNPTTDTGVASCMSLSGEGLSTQGQERAGATSTPPLSPPPPPPLSGRIVTANPPRADDSHVSVGGPGASLSPAAPSHAQASVSAVAGGEHENPKGNSTCGDAGCTDPQCCTIIHELQQAKMTTDLLLKAACAPHTLTPEEQRLYHSVLAARAQAMHLGLGVNDGADSSSDTWGSGSECDSLCVSPLPLLFAGSHAYQSTLPLHRSSLSRGANPLTPPV